MLLNLIIHNCGWHFWNQYISLDRRRYSVGSHYRVQRKPQLGKRASIRGSSIIQPSSALGIRLHGRGNEKENARGIINKLKKQIFIPFLELTKISRDIAILHQILSI